MTQVTKMPQRQEGQSGINTEAKKGKCARCGRALSDPVSIRRGLGPTCYKKFANETERLNRLEVEDQLQLESPKQYTKKEVGARRIFTISCKAGELQKKLRENWTLLEALMKEYQKKTA